MALEDHDADARPASLEERNKNVDRGTPTIVSRKEEWFTPIAVKLWPQLQGTGTKRVPDRLSNVQVPELSGEALETDGTRL
jgi:hypothetical protein